MTPASALQPPGAGDAPPLRVELARKAIHLGCGLIPIAYAVWGDRVRMALVLGVMSAVMLALERLRRRDGPIRRLFEGGFGFMLRGHEQRDRWLGATHYCIASLLCTAAFARPIAVLAMLYLALGDTAAALVGRRWGRVRLGRKTLEGALAFGAVCSCIAALAHALSPAYELGPALAAAWTAAVVEWTGSRWDDNWTVPLAAAVVMAGLWG